MNLDQKKKIVEELHQRLNRSTIVVLTEYKGLNVAAVSELRQRLRKENIDYQVVKNTLLRRAAENTNVALIKDYFKGPSAIAISYDNPTIPAKILSEFAKEYKKLQVVIGILDNKVLDPSALKALSDLPSREQLLAQVLAAMQAVPTSFVRVMSNIPQGFLNVLTAIKNQKQAA